MAANLALKSAWKITHIVGAVLALGVGHAWAADSAAPLIDPENPDFGNRSNELVVVGQRGAVEKAPVKSSLEATEPQAIVTREAIDQFVPGTADFVQIVNLTPSMAGTSYNGPGLGEAKSTLRGFKDGEYNITYDGIPWGDANGPTHHSTSFFPSSTVGAVVVDRGPGEASQLGQATFGGSVNMFSPEVSDYRGGSQSITGGSWNTWMAVTKLNTGAIDQLGGAKLLVNLQELFSDGYQTHSDTVANNQMFRAVLPFGEHWTATLFGTWNYTRVHNNDNNKGPTLDQVALYGKNYGLSDDPNSPNFYQYNIVEKHTYFNYAKLAGDVTDGLKLDDTIYSYYYKNATDSTRDPTLTPNDIAGIDPTNPNTPKATVLVNKGIYITQVPGGAKVAGHIPAYLKLNIYKIYGNILHVEQQTPIGVIKAGLWAEHADTGPRARVDYEAGTRAPDYRQKVLPGVSADLEYYQHSGWKQYQPFVDFEWNVTPKLKVTPGVKYMNFDLSVNTDVNQGSREPFHASKTFSKTLYFLTANYKLQENLAVYGQFATGMLVPDISTTQVTKPNLSQLEPQESKNYQSGFVFHSDRLTLDGDVYYIAFKNKLQSRFDAVSGETVSYNLGGATYKGVEASATFLITPQVYVFANGSLNSAKTVGVPALGIVANKQIANAPKSTASFGAAYSHGPITVSLIDKYTGEQWAVEGEPAAYHIPGFHSADLTAVLKLADGRYRIEGAVYNLFDSQKFTQVTAGKTLPYDEYVFQPERNFQVSFKMNF